jgi:hypothetical protein
VTSHHDGREAFGAPNERPDCLTPWNARPGEPNALEPEAPWRPSQTRAPTNPPPSRVSVDTYHAGTAAAGVYEAPVVSTIRNLA